MTKILFICHGNICRSPMAERVFRAMAAEAGRAGEFRVDSAATSREEIGNPIYPPAARLLNAHGIDSHGHAARQVTSADYAAYDHLVLMDENNRRNLHRLLGGDPAGKVSLLMEWAGKNKDVADPWYTGDFEATYRDVSEGCAAILKQL